MKFTIVTPVHNSEQYIAKTIESVISQRGNFDIEYLIQDGGSNDGTVSIIKKYEELLRSRKWNTACHSITFSWRSEQDRGMYDAVNRGFRNATGDIYAYINADDIYLPDAFQKIASVFETFKDVLWVTGTCPLIDLNDIVFKEGSSYLFNQEWIAQGMYGRSAYFIPQNAVFWRSSLWKKSGPCDSQYRYAGDYDLWIKFAKHAKLWSLDEPISCFRKRPGQLSSNISAYKKEQQKIYPKTQFNDFFIRAFFSIKARCNGRFESSFLWFYHQTFLEKNALYLKIEEGSVVKKPAYSYFTNK